MPPIQTLKIQPYEQKKCPSCGSPITKRNGTREGKQLYKVQMCQFHMGRIVDRYLTKRPRLKASVALKGLMGIIDEKR